MYTLEHLVFHQHCNMLVWFDVLHGYTLKHLAPAALHTAQWQAMISIMLALALSCMLFVCKCSESMPMTQSVIVPLCHCQVWLTSCPLFWWSTQTATHLHSCALLRCLGRSGRTSWKGNLECMPAFNMWAACCSALMPSYGAR